MRSGPVLPLPFALVALAMLADSARAGEMFVCPDKTVIHVTADTRAQLYEHPCVKAHFAAANAASAPAKPSAPTAITATASQASDGQTVNAAVAAPDATAAKQAPTPASAPEPTKTEIKTVRFGKRH